jgi:hypothetical protein
VIYGGKDGNASACNTVSGWAHLELSDFPTPGVPSGKAAAVVSRAISISFGWLSFSSLDTPSTRDVTYFSFNLQDCLVYFVSAIGNQCALACKPAILLVDKVLSTLGIHASSGRGR